MCRICHWENIWKIISIFSIQEQSWGFQFSSKRRCVYFILKLYKYILTKDNSESSIEKDSQFKIPETGIEGTIQTNCFPSKDEQGKVEGGVCVIHDITEWKLNAKQLEEARYNNIFYRINICIEYIFLNFNLIQRFGSSSHVSEITVSCKYESWGMDLLIYYFHIVLIHLFLDTNATSCW